jgi:hypothetical protein
MKLINRIHTTLAALAASVFAAITGKGAFPGKTISLKNLGYEEGHHSPQLLRGTTTFCSIEFKRSCRTSNQRKRRKHFRAQIANGSV